MVLRILWLKENRPETWEQLDMLMDHLEDQKTESKKKNIIIDFIRVHCKLTQFSQKEILHVIGSISYNLDPQLLTKQLQGFLIPMVT